MYDEFGILKQYILDETVTDILINSPNDIYIDTDLGMQKTAISFESSAELKEFACKLATLSGKRLDDAKPSVDASLPGGIRVHAILPPISGKSPYVSIRILRKKTLTLNDLVKKKTLALQQLEQITKYIKSGKNIFISGSTGSGKTTLLKACLEVVPKSERIITIEESFEIGNSFHPHIIGMQTKENNQDNKGEYTLSKLVKQSLRMRPDRIVLGECRGEEVLDVLTALNTGHSGSMATIHANSSKDVLPRLIALGTLASVSPKSIKKMAVSGIDYIIHITKDKDSKRRYVETIEKFC